MINSKKPRKFVSNGFKIKEMNIERKQFKVKTDTYVKICPQCGSTNVKMPHAGLDIKMTLRDECLDCKNISNFPEIRISRIEEFRKNLKK